MGFSEMVYIIIYIYEHYTTIEYIAPMPMGNFSKSPGDWCPVSVLPLPSKIFSREGGL